MINNLTYNIGFLFLLISSQLWGQEKIDTNENAILWKIEGKGIQESYLFGTIHLISKDRFYFPKSLEKKILKSKQVVLEIAEMPDRNEAMELLKLEKGTFFDFFDSLQIDSITQWTAKNWGMKKEVFAKTFENLQPFAFSQMVTQMKYMNNTASYDLTIMELAKSNKITTLGLETASFQMQLFSKLPKEMQTKMVMESIRGQEKQDSLFVQMQERYKNQDLKGLANLMQEKDGGLSEQTDVFLTQRNLNWIPLIEKHLMLNKTFIAVGAGHLPGKNGVIQLLRDKGYTLTPISL